MTEKIAITGGIAEGKSTVLRILDEFGILTFSCDQYVKELYTDLKIVDLLKKAVGYDPINERENFRRMFFNHLDFREAIEAIIHPLVTVQIQKSKAKYIEIPLLFEKGLNKKFKEIWVTTCGRKTQWKRLLQRVKDPVLAAKILESQWSTKKKILLANQVIQTNRPMYQIRKQVDLLLRIC